MAGEDPNKWDRYREYNSQAQASYLLGFEPDLREFQEEYDHVSQIYRRYDNPLLTGSVEPGEFRSIALEQMERAGIDTIRQALQQQVDTWCSHETKE